LQKTIIIYKKTDRWLDTALRRLLRNFYQHVADKIQAPITNFQTIFGSTANLLENQEYLKVKS